MPSQDVRRTLNIGPGPVPWLHSITLKPPLRMQEQYEDTYAAAYDINYETDPRPYADSFNRSIVAGSTEILFGNQAGVNLAEVAQRIITVLADKHQLTVVLEGTISE